MLGAESDAGLLGESVYDVIAPEHRARFRAFNEQVCSGQGGSLEFEIVTVGGTRRSMATNAVPLPVPGGFVQLAITRDVTEEALAAEALAQSKARLDYAARVSGLGFWYCDLPFDELVWDERVKQHFQLDPDARVTIESFYERLHPDDREPTRTAIERSLANGTTYDVTYRTVHPDTGAVKWIRALGGAVYGSDGGATHFDGVTVDVTEQKQGEQRLAALNEQLREHDRRKDEFLATLAHELRNPLAPVRTGLQILAATQDQEEARKARDMMERQVGHLVRMVDDLLDLSRVTLGKVTLQKRRIDFQAALGSALEATRPLIEARGHELAVVVSGGPFPLDADSTRLSQVIANVVNNAARYTPPNGRIELAAERRGDDVVVRVEDSGIGIHAQMLPHVFDMFTQADATLEQSKEGLGIGLTLVRKLVEMHGGAVDAHSDGPGRGSTFTIRLPLARGPWSRRTLAAARRRRERSRSACSSSTTTWTRRRVSACC
jgi:signal transduction histidine kinase